MSSPDAHRPPGSGWLSAIVLVGLVCNAAFNWWWADPLAALGIVYIAAREGIAYSRSEQLDDCC